MDREKIVSNGCSGNCCERFTMGYSLPDMVTMKSARDQGKTTFIDSQNRERDVKTDNTLHIILDMLIPLGTTYIEPNGLYNYDNKHPDIKEQIDLKNEKAMEYYLVDDKYQRYVFTCRHFDTVNRICGNYENRPGMCKSFGVGCAYKGCSYNKTVNELDEQNNINKEDGGI